MAQQMTPQPQQARITAREPALRYRRALVTWLIAYVGIEVIGFAAGLLLAAAMHSGSYADPTREPSYIAEEWFLPAANLVLWTLLALAYFGKRPGRGRSRLTESVRLGTFWLAVSLPADFVFFVAIKNPSSLTAHEFYVGQFPWIYLVYAAVFVSPLCAAAIRARR